METSIPWFFWLFPISFALHNVEEAIWFPAFSKSAGKFHKPVEKYEFTFAVVILTLLSFIITILFSIHGKLSIACYLYFAFNFGMLINVFFPHLVATIFSKKYCPGLLTGILFLIPTTVYILLFGYNNEYFIFPKFWYIAIPFAGLVIWSIPILFKVGKYFQKKAWQK
jgi:Na+(H+)/acetate symporter ActP